MLDNKLISISNTPAFASEIAYLCRQIYITIQFFLIFTACFGVIIGIMYFIFLSYDSSLETYKENTIRDQSMIACTILFLQFLFLFIPINLK